MICRSTSLAIADTFCSDERPESQIGNYLFNRPVTVRAHVGDRGGPCLSRFHWRFLRCFLSSWAQCRGAAPIPIMSSCWI
jgi:hypothetical protein